MAGLRTRWLAYVQLGKKNWSNSPEAKEKAAECESGGFLFNFKLLGVTTG
jgi:hypothetical protein